VDVVVRFVLNMDTN